MCHDATRLALLLPQFDQQECVKSRARWFCLSTRRREPDAAFSLYLVCCELCSLFWNMCFPSLALFGFFLNMLQNRVAVLQDGYFNLLFSIFNKIPSIVTWVCHAGHIKMSTLSHVYLRVTSNVNPNLEWLCLNRMNHLLLFLFQSRVISFSA